MRISRAMKQNGAHKMGYFFHSLHQNGEQKGRRYKINYGKNEINKIHKYEMYGKLRLLCNSLI